MLILHVLLRISIIQILLTHPRIILVDLILVKMRSTLMRKKDLKIYLVLINMQTFKTVIENQASLFLCQLYGNVNLTSKLINEIVENFTNLLENIKNIISPKIIEINSKKLSKDNEQILYLAFAPFSSVRSEYAFRTYLRKKELFFNHTTFNMDRKIQSRVRKGIPTLREKIKTGILMPIEEQIKHFFLKT